MASEEQDRTEGVDFTEIDKVLDDLSFPVTKQEFVAEYGNLTIERTNADPIAVEDLFEGTGDDTFDDEEEVRQSILNLMPKESVGRQRYSDRAGETPEEGQPESGDDVSF